MLHQTIAFYFPPSRQVVRLSLAWAEDLLEDPQLAAMKVIHLTRDPRAVLR